MIKVGWARPESTFRRVFSSMTIPRGTEEQACWVDALQRMSTSPASAMAMQRAIADIDVTEILPGLDVPTLVLHARGDQVRPFHFGRELAALIPGSRLVALNSDNHILLQNEPATQVFQHEVTEFLAAAAYPAKESRRKTALRALTSQERRVLEFAASGRDDQAIADELSLSIRTIERHLQTSTTSWMSPGAPRVPQPWQRCCRRIDDYADAAAGHIG